jgi:DNA-directed RNA polymerase subunit E"
MVKQKACKICKKIYEGDKCTDCGSQEYSEDFKGRIMVFSVDNSEIAQKLKLKKAGLYAIKNR